MCPEVEKRLAQKRIEKYRSIQVPKRHITRRSLLKSSIALPFIFHPVLPGLFPSSSFAGLSFDIFNWGCVKCELGFCMCKVVGIELIPSIYNKYWYPVGFMEINRECQFLTSLLPLLGEVVGELLGKLCGLIPTGWVQAADMSQNEGIGKYNQQYMRVHARWYGLTPETEALIDTYLTVAELCPCSLVEAAKNVVLGPAFKKLSNIEKKLSKFGNKFKKLKDAIQKVTEVLKSLGGVPLPIWFTEILSPIWTTDFLSVDNVLFANAGLRQALLGALASSPLGHIAVCSGLLQQLEKLGISIQGMLDPDFFCVGVWGYGYPRIGIVRSDDPLIAHLLAVARFHHLYSKTIPVIPFEFSYDSIRYQLVRPFSSECMRPGCGGTTIPSLCEIIENATNPTALLDTLKNKATLVEGRTMNALDRKTFLVVWKKKKRCCC